MTLNQDLSRRAIKAALESDWPEAIKLNQQILKTQAKDIAALNRLTRAYLENNQLKQAKIQSNKVLRIDSANPIALKNQDRIKLNKGGNGQVTTKAYQPSFIEEPGRTKTIKVIRPGSKELITGLSAGEKLTIIPKKHLISLEVNEQYIGSVPEVLSFRLIKLIKKGNRYQAWVKSTQAHEVSVFLKETFQDPKAKNLISFP